MRVITVLFTDRMLAIVLLPAQACLTMLKGVCGKP